MLQMMAEATLTLHLLKYRVLYLSVVYLSSLIWPGFVFLWEAEKLYCYACVAVNCEFYLGLCGDKFMPV